MYIFRIFAVIIFLGALLIGGFWTALGSLVVMVIVAVLLFPDSFD